MNSEKKQLVLKYESILSKIYRLFGRNHISVKKGNTLKLNNAFAKCCKFHVGGINNIVEIESGFVRLSNVSIRIYGSDNHIVIMGGANLKDVSFYIEDNGGHIIINRNVTICGNTHLAVIEGKKIEIGEDCLLSSQIYFRTGDSHSILDRTTGKRINPSMDIEIGNHVWIGNDVKILKGVKVGEHSIISTGAILSAGNYPSNSIIGGIGHGKVLKTDVDWVSQRISLTE